jgi:hypothetical protein
MTSGYFADESTGPDDMPGGGEHPIYTPPSYEGNLMRALVHARMEIIMTMLHARPFNMTHAELAMEMYRSPNSPMILTMKAAEADFALWREEVMNQEEEERYGRHS